MARENPTADTLDRVEELCARVRRRFLQHELRSVRVLRRVAQGV
jgi:hypothetical protein